jgi:hypothetical protein
LHDHDISVSINVAIRFLVSPAEAARTNGVEKDRQDSTRTGDGDSRMDYSSSSERITASATWRMDLRESMLRF